MNSNKLRRTPSQTVGPFFAYSLAAEQYGYDYNSLMNHLLIDPDTEGERITITGKIYDGEGQAIPDALIELWQADERGVTVPALHQKNDGFTGFGRLGTGPDAQHRFVFTTVKPGAIGKGQAPHINIILLMRGSLHQLYTRLYFSDEEESNRKDEVLNTVPEERRTTLLAQRKVYVGGITYHFDIYMQGENETVFLKFRNHKEEFEAVIATLIALK